MQYSETFERIKELIVSGNIRVSEHGYDELANDGLFVREIVSSIESGTVVEDYPNYPKGASVLVLQNDLQQNPIHVVWGIPKGHNSPAVLVTAYRPDPERWNETFTERKI